VEQLLYGLYGVDAPVLLLLLLQHFSSSSGRYSGRRCCCSKSTNVTWSVEAASSLSEGYYMCNASNTAGWATATTYLDIKGFTICYAHILFSYLSIYLRAAERLLQCKITQCYPPLDIGERTIYLNPSQTGRHLIYGTLP